METGVNRIEPVHAIEREALWVRVRRRPLAQQIAIAALAVAVLLLAAYWLFLRPAAPAGPDPRRSDRRRRAAGGDHDRASRPHLAL
jgi:hypothetical protein